jgi:transcriptional regulator with XRE-family HTH domain
MDIREVFAKNVRRRRRSLGLSQEELAARANIDRTYVSAIERKKHSVTLDVVAEIAASLGSHPADLLKE